MTDEGRHLVVSGFGDDTGGGLYRVDPAAGEVERLDDIACTGLWSGDGRLARLVRVPAEVSGPCELLVHDPGGLRTHLRVDAITDPHDLLWDGDRWVVTSSDRNSVTWLDGGGRIVDEWRPSVVPDSWHVNCLLVDGDRLLLSSFGRFDGSREWSGDAARGAGVLFDLRSGTDVLTGLTHPHTPRPGHDGGWVICASLDGEVVAFDQGGDEVARVHLGGYTRGLAPQSGGGWHVGVSGRREKDSFAAVATVDASWKEVARVGLPCREVYDLALVDDEVLAGLRRGADVSPARTSASGPGAGLPASEPLDPAATSVQVEVSALPEAAGQRVVEVPCTITNHSDARWVTGPPNPVHLAYRWYPQGSDGSYEDGLRTVLTRDVRPGESLTVPLRLGPPSGRGLHRLVVTLVQEGVRWFDEVDAAHRWERDLEL